MRIKGERVTIVCEQCGKHKEGYASVLRGQRFCSRACRGLSVRRRMYVGDCLACDKPIHRQYGNAVQTRSKGRGHYNVYCDATCMKAHRGRELGKDSLHCTMCEETKPVVEFWLDVKRNCYASRCKVCSSSNPKLVANRRKRQRTSHLKIRFGITLTEWHRIWEAQGKACAICRVSVDWHPEVEGRGRTSQHLAVDHRHDETKKVRGLLCGPCNRGLGSFRDDPRRLRQAALYIEASEGIFEPGLGAGLL
jgi:hypothetical protein